MIIHQTNKQILDELNKEVIGHIKAKKALIASIRRAWLYYYCKWVINIDSNLPLKQNLVLVGASGTGKTFMVETLADILSLPFVFIDGSRFSPLGAKDGINVSDLEDIINHELRVYKSMHPEDNSTYQGLLARSIIFIDEFDKISTSYDGSSSESWNKQTQSQLLKFIEEYSRDSFIIFAGAFTGLNLVTQKPKHIGFNKVEDEVQCFDTYSALIKYGFIPELVGRMGQIQSLDKFEVKHFKKILKECVLPRFKDLEKFYNKKWRLSRKLVDKLSKEAYASEQGVRYLYNRVAEHFASREFDAEIWPDLTERLINNENN